MNTFWKNMAAFGFGLAFALCSSTAVLANGGEGFDFTDVWTMKGGMPELKIFG